MDTVGLLTMGCLAGQLTTVDWEAGLDRALSDVARLVPVQP